MPVSVLWESSVRVLWCEVDAGGCRWATVTQLRSYFSMVFFLQISQAPLSLRWLSSFECK